MRKKIKLHIFEIIFGVCLTIYFAFLGLVFFAPRVDLYKRGFVSCTEDMITEFSACTKNKIWCFSKIMLKNQACDFRVVKNGFALWLKGEQKTPWANYYFVPVEENLNPTEDEELQAYYQKHSDFVKEMEELNNKYFELEESLKNKTPELPVVPQQTKGEENEQK